MYKKQLRKLIFCPLLLLVCTWTMAQDITVNGKVTDTGGQGIPGVSILVEGTVKGTNTDMDGNYRIAAAGNSSLIFSSVGYIKQTLLVNSRSTINVVLQDSQKTLDEVVVVGYGTQKRRDITGSVSSVKGDVFKDQPITNPLEALQGRTPGVDVVTSSGQPGAKPSIVIRGLVSLFQPDPLIIIDGIRVPDASNLNVQDIASINVLKDASSAAIYGSAAAGGVVLITTKRGTSDKPAINFSARYGITKPKLISLLDKDNFIALQNIINPKIFAGATRLDTLANTDWVHTLYRDANEQNYDLSIAGSSPVVNYLVSGYYNAQTGIFLKNYSNIGGARVNTEYKLGKYVKLGEQLTLSQRITSPLVGAEAQLHNPPFRTQPIIPIYNANGSFGSEPTGYPGLSFSGPNPYGAIQAADAQALENNVQANVFADIKLPLHLDFRSNFGYSYNIKSQDYFQNSYNFGPVASTSTSLNKFTNQSSQLLSNYVLTYDQSIGKHNINAIVGYEQITAKYNTLNASESNVGLPGYSFIKTNTSDLTVDGNYDPNALTKSQFARLNYNYNNRYYISGSIRQDANFTVFGPNKRRGIFRAASVGWNIGDESFFKPLSNTINALKLRASYGTLGNDAIPPYTYQSSYKPYYSPTNSSPTGGGQNFSPGGPILLGNSFFKIPNPDLHWETVSEANVGVDGEALNGHLYFTAEYYYKNTTGMLYALQLPLSSGFPEAFYSNIGTVNNKGFDFLLGYRNKTGKFSYDITATAGFNKNMVTSLSGVASENLRAGYNYYSIGDAGFALMSNENLTITRAGLPFGSYYGYKVLGVFQTDADAAAQKVNGKQAHAGDLIYDDPSHTGNITEADKQVIGNPNPHMVYGFNIHLNAYGFDVAMLFNGVAGVQLFNGIKAYEQALFADGNTTNQVFGDSFLGGNGLTAQPRLGVVENGGFTMDPNHNYSSVNSYFVENGDYLKLKNLQLGYTFSGKFLDQIKVKSARLFVMTNNVFTITKYKGLDPELGGQANGGTPNIVLTRGVDAVPQYPHTKIYSAGLNITF